MKENDDKLLNEHLKEIGNYYDEEITKEHRNSYIDIAKLYFDNKDYNKMIEYVEYALDIEKKLNEKNTRVKGCLYSILASGYDLLNQYDKGEKHFEQFLKIKEKLKFNTNGSIPFNFATIYIEEEKFDKAILEYEKAMKVEKKKSIEMAEIYASLGICYDKLKNDDKSKNYYKKAIKMYDALIKVAIYYLKYEKAKKYGEKSLQLKTIIYKKNSIPIRESYYTIGYCHNKMGNHYDAITNLKIANKIDNETLVEKDVVDVKIYQIIGASYFAVGDKDKGIMYSRKAENLGVKLFKTNNEDIIELGKYTGIACLQLQKNSVARNYFKESLEMELQSDNGNKNNILMLNFYIGQTFYSEKKYKKAIKHFEDAIVIYDEGGTNADLFSILNYTAESYRHLKKCEDAKSYFQRALKVREEQYGIEDKKAVKIKESLKEVENVKNSKFKLF